MVKGHTGMCFESCCLCNKKIHSVILVALFIACLLNFLIKENTSAALPTLSLTLSNNTISLDIISTDTNGNFASSNDISITANTNNYSGYTLSISSNASNASLNGPYDTASGALETLDSIGLVTDVTSSGVSAETFGDSSNTQFNNTWGYKPSKRNSLSNTNFLPAPSTSGDILDITSSANANNVANDYTMSIGARVTPDTQIGTYTNTFVISLVANLTSYSITFNANDGYNGLNTSNMPSPNPKTGYVNTSSPNVALPFSVPTRNGYQFNGWCTVQVADGESCSGTEYQAGGIYTADFTSSNIFTLYARWERSGPCSVVNSLLHCKVMDEWITGGSRIQTNDTNVNTGIQAEITTANSGVFKYNRTAFGADSDSTRSDGTKDDIYYYRGILDQNIGSYGSNGDGARWPNYVVLSAASTSSGITTSDTCWRIVRTTASDGIKLIYNGKWTGSTCANATTSAQVTTSKFNDTSASNGYTSLDYRNIHSAGYTYNNSVNDVTEASSNTTVAKVFGNNSNFSVNKYSSIMKQYLENTWFTNINDYKTILEPSAGYCNDRTLNEDISFTTSLSDSTQIIPYGTSGLPLYYFGSYARNYWSVQKPSLGCPRNKVDLYSSNVSNGNGQMTYPVGLITADELSFAGSGQSTPANGSTNHANSYANSGSNYWTLSPFFRPNYGSVFMFMNGSSGGQAYYEVNYAQGVRPTISLVAGTTVASGSGTATSPWIVNPKTKKYMQDFTKAMCQAQATDQEIVVYDRRDGSDYTVRYIDGACWMTQNLRITKSTGQSDWVISKTDSNFSNVNTWNIHAGGEVGSGSSYTQAQAHSSDESNAASTVVMYYYSAPDGRGINKETMGVYYNFCAASAGNSNGCNSTEIYASGSGDICPAGWHLPIYNEDTVNYPIGNFVTLDGEVEYGGTNSASKFNPVRSGLYFNSNTFFPGTGNYWTSTGKDRLSQYIGYLSYDTMDSTVSSFDTKIHGQSIRCVRTETDISTFYTIVYNGNGASSSNQMAVTHSNIVPNQQIELYASNYKRPGYGFAGWSFTQIDPDASNASTLIANATIYGPNEKITAPSAPVDGTGTKTLYAVWVKSAADMQNWSGCSSLSTNGLTALMDQRDHQVYAVAKLADGKCWMIENIRLENTATTGNNSYNSSVTNKSLAQGYGGSFTGLASPEASSKFLTSNSNSKYNLGTFNTPRYNNVNTASAVSSMTTGNQNVYSYGNYYSFTAANAITSVTSAAGSTSICPKGWRLPTGTTNGDIDNLFNLNVVSGTTGMLKFPNNFLMSGAVYRGNIDGRGTVGYYWSQSYYNSANGYGFLSTNSSSYLQSGHAALGEAVRCIVN